MDVLAGAGAAILYDKMEAVCEAKKNKGTEGFQVSKILEPPYQPWPAST